MDEGESAGSPTPSARYEVVAPIGEWGWLCRRVLSGDRPGQLVAVRAERRPIPAGFVPTKFGELPFDQAVCAERRARELLESLMTEAQIYQLESKGWFSVDTALGLFRITDTGEVWFTPKFEPSRELWLCVGAEDEAALPPCDRLANLLLWVTADPGAVIERANVIGEVHHVPLPSETVPAWALPEL